VISLDQSKGDAGAMRAALGELAAGRCVLIFPEGTRTRDGAMHEFKPGAALIIRRSGAPVVPVAIEGAFDVWRIGTSLPRLSGRIAVRAGPALAAEELMRDGTAKALTRMHGLIESMRLELRSRMRRESGGRYPAPGPGDAPQGG
jgi:1-acyl-sn-glycerol-3-phosphate acyltransferase